MKGKRYSKFPFAATGNSIGFWSTSAIIRFTTFTWAENNVHAFCRRAALRVHKCTSPSGALIGGLSLIRRVEDIGLFPFPFFFSVLCTQQQYFCLNTANVWKSLASDEVDCFCSVVELIITVGGSSWSTRGAEFIELLHYGAARGSCFCCHCVCCVTFSSSWTQ